MSSVDSDAAEWLAGPGVPAPDAELDHVVRRVRDVVGVPGALVALVHGDRQVFPARSGLAEPDDWSPGWRVATTAAEFAVADVRADPSVEEPPVVDGFVVAGCAGVPVTGEDGAVLGSVWAVDTAPRDWTDDELALLRGAARACATELRLRLARHAADVERANAEELRDRLAQSLLRAQLLLTASQALSDVSSVAALRDRITDLVIGDLKPSRVALVLTQDRGAAGRIEDQRDAPPGDGAPGPDGQWDEFHVDAPTLAAKAVRERRLVHQPDLRDVNEVAAGMAAHYLDEGFVSVTCAPIIDAHEVLGVLELAWNQPHVPDAWERTVVATITGYVASALRRARYLQHRISVAQDLQQAMLTDLPALPGLRVAARYVPADAEEQVGGDWYDAFPLPRADSAVAVVVGDVTGHDIQAATDMGQLRAMLRQACWQGGAASGPAAALTELDEAVGGLAVGASGTAVLGYLTPVEHGDWLLTFTNAGHPPPVVAHPDRRVELLTDHDHLLGYVTTFSRTRTERTVRLTPGSTVLFYTDGLVELPGTDLDERIAALAALVGREHGPDPNRLAEVVLRGTSPDRPDDVAVLVVHLPAEDRAPEAGGVG